VTRYVSICECRHTRDVHTHYRKGRDCSQCRCPEYHRPNMFVGILWALVIEVGATAAVLWIWKLRRWWT
jgi:hypothetical protein